MIKNDSEFDTAVLIRRALFFLVLALLLWAHLVPLFRGLGTPAAMDQAQIARQVARGEGLTTKFLRPLDYHLAENEEEAPVSFVLFKDSYQSPLNPLVLGAVMKLVGADNAENWEMGDKEMIYPLDRVVALVSTLFFLMAMGVTYLLVGRVFDAKIAGVTLVMMLFCNLLWSFAQSGLPQMLMLLLFSCGLYFSYRAIEDQAEGKGGIAQPVIAAVFFSLLVLTHWLAAWIFLGFLVFAAIAFRPRGIIALAALGVLAVFVIGPLVRNAGIVGQPFGTAFYVLYNGLANGSEEAVMRTTDIGSEPLYLNGLLLKILSTTLVQATDLVPFLGGILAAPIFFVALLHPFRRPSISSFRWLVALMWLFAAVGMAIYGIDAKQGLHANQLHILFAPIMAAYGLAFLSILWSRLEVVNEVPMLRNAHLFAIVLLSAAPMLLSLPREVRNYVQVFKAGFPQWPPYYPRVLNLGLTDWVDREGKQQEIVVSDQPWAVAWYSDCVSLWLPKDLEGFDLMEEKASNLGTPFAGILVTPSSHSSGTGMEVASQYGDFAPMVFDGRIAQLTKPDPNRSGLVIYDKTPQLERLSRRYPHREPVIGNEMIYYSAKELRPTPTR